MCLQFLECKFSHVLRNHFRTARIIRAVYSMRFSQGVGINYDNSNDTCVCHIHCEMN